MDVSRNRKSGCQIQRRGRAAVKDVIRYGIVFNHSRGSISELNAILGDTDRSAPTIELPLNRTVVPVSLAVMPFFW